ncbi:hypothetical protein, partial [Bifidobacterium apri]|uniref:hypothetical protein n=1 Tax=Bifidobacterium apri TaxID=1769423 RepID=UPI0035EC5386
MNNGYHPRRAIKWNIGDILDFASSARTTRFQSASATPRLGLWVEREITIPGKVLHRCHPT